MTLPMAAYISSIPLCFLLSIFPPPLMIMSSFVDRYIPFHMQNQMPTPYIDFHDRTSAMESLLPFAQTAGAASDILFRPGSESNTFKTSNVKRIPDWPGFGSPTANAWADEVEDGATDSELSPPRSTTPSSSSPVTDLHNVHRAESPPPAPLVPPMALPRPVPKPPSAPRKAKLSFKKVSFSIDLGANGRQAADERFDDASVPATVSTSLPIPSADLKALKSKRGFGIGRLGAYSKTSSEKLVDTPDVINVCSAVSQVGECESVDTKHGIHQTVPGDQQPAAVTHAPPNAPSWLAPSASKAPVVSLNQIMALEATKPTPTPETPGEGKWGPSKGGGADCVMPDDYIALREQRRPKGEKMPDDYVPMRLRRGEDHGISSAEACGGRRGHQSSHENQRGCDRKNGGEYRSRYHSGEGEYRGEKEGLDWDELARKRGLK